MCSRIVASISKGKSASVYECVRFTWPKKPASRRIGSGPVPAKTTWHGRLLGQVTSTKAVVDCNRLVENGGWDKSILAIELQYLLTLDCADFDVTITGFEIPEIDVILEEANQASATEDAVPELITDEPPVTKLGDQWLLGKHRIICGNALHEQTYRALMGKNRAAVVWTDPPFNVKIDGHATGKGAIHHREFAMASGEMSDAEFVSFLTNAIDLAARFSAVHAIAYICMDWRHIADLIRAAMQSYDEFANLCVWVKDNGGMGSFYRSQHELVVVLRKGKGRNNVQLGKFGRNRTNVWQYPGILSLSKQSDEGNLLTLHPTTKPIRMVEMGEHSGETRDRFEKIFDTIGTAMKTAAKEENHLFAADEAKRFGLVSTVPSRGPGEAWQIVEDGFTLWFQWRYYDQSRPFSIQKDMNILSLELREGDKVLRRAEERFED